MFPKLLIKNVYVIKTQMPVCHAKRSEASGLCVGKI